jgi:chromosome partitioning protein
VISELENADNTRFTADPKTPAEEPLAAKVLAVVNQKGGVGKTTTAINLSAGLAMEGLETLLIDCDPQANTTGGLGFGRNEARLSVYDVLMGSATIAEVRVPTTVESLTLVPGSKNMIGANLELVAQERRELRLRDAIVAVRGDYRFIVLDCPPALDLLTLNALVAADGLLVPMQAEYFALEGISELMQTLDRITQAFNPGLSLEGVLMTMYDDRTNLSQQVMQNLRHFFGEKLLKTTIPRNIRLAEAPSHGKPVQLYDPRSKGAEAYGALAAELLSLNGMVSPRARERQAAAKKAGDAGPRFWPYSQ